MLDGRVKTLHPKVHGGLLARRDLPEHMAALKAHGIETIDLLVVNLYPFEATVAKPGCTLEDAIENIDIGGPAMVRSAAKNWKDVGVLTDASQYPGVLDELKTDGKLSDKTRFALSVAAFNRISNYDAAISDYLSSIQEDGSAQPVSRRRPTAASSSCRTCATARTRTSRPRSTATCIRRPARWSRRGSCRARSSPTTTSPTPMRPGNASRASTRRPASSSSTPIPAAWRVGKDALEAYSKAFKTDPTSAFGGIIAFNRTVDGAAAQAVSKQFVEVLMAPGFHAPRRWRCSRARSTCASCRSRCRRAAPPTGTTGRNAMDIKRVGSGLLMQTADNRELTLADLKVVTKKQPTPEQLQDLLFAWKVAKFVKSNAIVFCKDGMTMGVGAGQMSRLDSARIASIKAAACRPVAARHGGGQRRVLPVPRRPRRGGGRRARPASSSPAAACATRK